MTVAVWVVLYSHFSMVRVIGLPIGYWIGPKCPLLSVLSFCPVSRIVTVALEMIEPIMNERAKPETGAVASANTRLDAVNANTANKSWRIKEWIRPAIMKNLL